MSESESHRRAGLAAFRHLDFTLYELERFFVVAALEMMSVAVGWQVYEITRRPLDLGLVGLAQFLPNVFLFLVAGHAADRFNRRNLLLICNVGFAVCAALLIEISHGNAHDVRPIYAVLVLLGVVRAFSLPASRALLRSLVPDDVFASAVAWNATVFQGATILGPALGGVLYAVLGGPIGVYAVSVFAYAVATIAVIRIRFVESKRER